MQQSTPSTNTYTAAITRVVARLGRIEKKIDARAHRGPVFPTAYRNSPVVDLSERPYEALDAGVSRTVARRASV